MDGGMVGSGGMVHGGVAVAMAVSASARVGVDEGHEGQDCREGLKHGIKLLRILCSSRKKDITYSSSTLKKLEEMFCTKICNILKAGLFELCVQRSESDPMLASM